MLSHSKLKRRRKRKGDDSFVWLGDVGTTSFRKGPKHKKRKKKVGVIITVLFIPCQSPFIFFKFNLLKLYRLTLIDTRDTVRGCLSVNSL